MLIPAKLYIDRIFYDTKIDDSVLNMLNRNRKRSFLDQISTNVSDTFKFNIQNIINLDVSSLKNKNNVSIFINKSELKLYDATFKIGANNTIIFSYYFYIFTKNIRKYKLKKILL